MQKLSDGSKIFWLIKFTTQILIARKYLLFLKKKKKVDFFNRTLHIK